MQSPAYVITYLIKKNNLMNKELTILNVLLGKLATYWENKSQLRSSFLNIYEKNPVGGINKQTNK